MIKLICVRCGIQGNRKTFSELDNKGSQEWVCKECEADLKADAWGDNLGD